MVTTAFAVIKAVIRGDFGAIKGIVINGASQIANAFRGLGAKMRVIGSQIISGLIGGIKAKMGGALASVRSLASQIASSARKALSIHSPSKVFMDIGGYVSQGMAVGIGKNANLAVAQTQQLANKMASVDFATNLNAGKQNTFDVGGEVKRTAEIRRSLAESLDIRVSIDGKVEGAKTQANVTTNSKSSNQGSNMPFALA